MERIGYLSNRMREINRELKLLPEKRRMLLEKIEFVEQWFLIESSRYRCLCLPFYAAVKNAKLEKTSRLTQLLQNGAERYLGFVKQRTGFSYKEKKAQLPPKIRENLLNAVKDVDSEIAKKKDGPEKIQWDTSYFFEESAKGTKEEDWGNLWGEGLCVYEALLKHHTKLSEELRNLDGRGTELDQELKLLETERDAAVFSCKWEPLQKRAAQLGINWEEFVNGIAEGHPKQRIAEATKKIEELEKTAHKKGELERTRKSATDTLTKLAKSRYEDISKKAETLLQKIKEEEAVCGTAAETQTLKNAENARNSIKERLTQEFEETRKKSGLVQKFFQNMGLKDSPAEKLELLGREKEFYAESYLERFLQVQEEIYTFYGLITDLNNIGKHKEMDLKKLKGKIAGAAQERDFDALEGIVQSLWEAVRNATKEGLTKNESEIAKKKKELGFELVRDLVILVRVENLRHCMGEGGLDILLKKATAEYPAKHIHTLSGIRGSLQKLGFKTQELMKADKVQIHMDKSNVQRLRAILELERIIKKERPAEK